MFQVNDAMIYGTHGVCRIVGIETKKIGGVEKDYYVLTPIHEKSSTFFVPTDNALIMKKMRRLLTEKEITQLIDSMPDAESAWIANDNDRKECYKKILADGDHKELIKMIKALYLHKKQREADGKRLHMADERFLKDAEQILHNEFQYVLNLKSKDEVLTYIFSRIEKA